MLAPLSGPQRLDLAAALGSARTLLESSPGRDFVIRTFRPGDLALLASRQAILYREEYGWASVSNTTCWNTVAAFLGGFSKAATNAGSPRWRRHGRVDPVTDEATGSRACGSSTSSRWRVPRIGDALIRACLGFAREPAMRR